MEGAYQARLRRTHHVGLAFVEALRLELLLLALERVELLEDVGVDKVGDVLAVHDLGHDVVLPFLVLEHVVLCAGPAQTRSATCTREGDEV